MPTEYYNNPEQPNRTISIIGFGGKAMGLPPNIIMPHTITGTFRRYARTTDLPNGTFLEHALITITRDQTINVGSKRVVLEKDKIYEIKGDNGAGYKLINTKENPLTVKNSNIRTGGRRKRHTKRRKAIRRTRRRRSIRT